MLAVCLHFGLKPFLVLSLLSLICAFPELDFLADSVVGVEGADSFFSQVIVAESAPVGKAHFFFDVRVVLQVELNLVSLFISLFSLFGVALVFLD
jgi:hypothetical protein